MLIVMPHPLFLEDAYQTDFEAEVISADETGVRLSQTVFYATSGGQPGDSGRLLIANDTLPIITTKKGESPTDIVHVLGEGCALPAIGTKLKGVIDWDTRHKHMRMHTLLHLVCSLVDAQITGCQIGADKSRIDMNMQADAVDKDVMTNALNKLIEENHPVSTRWIADEELLANPDLVRSMSVKPPIGYGQVRLVQIGRQDKIVDLQPCGGTHVKSTGEIGRIAISKIENKGKLNRRISLIFMD